MAHFKDLTGQKFGRLTIIGVDHKEKSGKRFRYYWECKCECGKVCTIRTDCLTSGNVRSCGCLHKETAIKNVSKHHSHLQSGTRLYGIWQKMKDRCANPNIPCYSRYGGRGIKVCDEWLHSFEPFYEWAVSHGYSDNLTIDRINNNGNYEPDNCRWITSREQCLNRRTNIMVNYGGKTMTLVEASEQSSIAYGALNARIKRGITGNDLFKPVLPKGQKREALYNGRMVSMKELSKLTGINRNTLDTRWFHGKRGADLYKDNTR